MSCLRRGLCAVVLVAAPSAVTGGVFFGAGQVDGGNPDVVFHPLMYTGTGGAIDISVCIDSGSAFRDQMVAPVKRAIVTWNAATHATGGYVHTTSSSVPSDHFDFESTVLHELGHVLGLGHTNLYAKLPFPDKVFFGNATNSTEGSNAQFDFLIADGGSIGLDGHWGSNDDFRGDDVSLFWFRTDTNNPFDATLPGTIDATTYSRDLGDLPGFDSWAMNATQAISVDPVLSYPDNTLAVMFDHQYGQSESRTLIGDDVATLRYGRSGLDEIQGTADDYSVHLTYFEIPPCNIILEFANLDLALLGKTTTIPNQIGMSNHWNTGSGSILFSLEESFYFGPAPDLVLTKDDGGVTVDPGDTISYTLSLSNVGDADATDVVLSDVIPSGTTFNAALSDPAWACAGTTAGLGCSLDVPGPIAPASGSLNYTFAVNVLNPTQVPEVSNTATVSVEEFDKDAANNSATDLTPVDVPCGGTEDLVLTLPGTDPVVVHEACNSITAGTTFTILTGRDVTFKARNLLELTDGFSVESGATFTADLDPLAGQAP